MIDIAGVTDLAGNAITPAVVRSFTTGPGALLSRLAVTGFNPPNLYPNAGTNTVLTVAVNQPLNPLTVNTSTVTLQDIRSGQFIAGAVSLSADGKSLTFTPNAPLQNDTYYFWQLTGIQDQEGNGVGLTGTFTTGLTAYHAAPTITAVNPPQGAQNVAINVIPGFLMIEPVDVLSVTNSSVSLTAGNRSVMGAVTLQPDTRTILFQPANLLSTGRRLGSRRAFNTEEAHMSFELILPFLRPIEPLLLDESISEIMGNPDSTWWYERDGILCRDASIDSMRRSFGPGLKSSPTSSAKSSTKTTRCSMRSSPMGAACSGDSSRRPQRSWLGHSQVHQPPLHLEDLIARGTLTRPLADFLAEQIEHGQTILISGGTGTGKTTLLNILGQAIPDHERIVVIEDTSELRIEKPNILPVECQIDTHRQPVTSTTC